MFFTQDFLFLLMFVGLLCIYNLLNVLPLIFCLSIIAIFLISLIQSLIAFSPTNQLAISTKLFLLKHLQNADITSPDLGLAQWLVPSLSTSMNLNCFYVGLNPQSVSNHFQLLQRHNNSGTRFLGALICDRRGRSCFPSPTCLSA